MDNLNFTPWSKGCTHIYTGNGKGKSTAAFGLALRAAAYDLKIYIAQFMKGVNYGENISFKKFSKNIVTEQFGPKNCIEFKDSPNKRDVDMAKKGLSKAKELLISNKFNIIILDEIIVSNYFKLIEEEEIIELINIKAKNIELILTGRYASEKLIKKADYVTEMKLISHPYENEGLMARDGVER